LTFARTPGDTVFEDFQNHQDCPGIPGIGVQLERNTQTEELVEIGRHATIKSIEEYKSKS